MLRWIMLLSLTTCLAACNGADIDAADPGGADLNTENGPATPEANNDAANGEPETNGQNDQPAAPATVDELLAQLEQAGQDSPAIQADIEYHIDQLLTGDSEHRTGTVKFQTETEDDSAKFYIKFDTLALGDGPINADAVEYAFNGRWLTIAKHRIKQMTRYEVAAEGQRIEAFKLGKGPFPLPFGQTAETMNTYFDITTAPPADDAPANTDYLLLIPKEDRAEELNFTRMEMWIDRTTHLPVKLISSDKSENVTTVIFTNIDSQPTFEPADFYPPRKAGWQYTQETLD